MRKFILTLLTTLFVSAMPLQAAYALADDANEQTDKQTCTTKDVFTPEQRQQVQDQGGEVVELEGVQASAFQVRVEELLRTNAPFQSDYILLVKPDGGEDTFYNVGFFVNNCLKAVLHIPAAVVPQLLGPKVPLGERVD